MHPRSASAVRMGSGEDGGKFLYRDVRSSGNLSDRMMMQFDFLFFFYVF